LLGSHTPALREASVCALLMTLLGLAPPYLVQHLVDSVLVRNEVRLLNALALGLALVAVFRALFALLREYLLAHVGRQVDLGLTAGYARHLLHLPMPFFEMRRVGEVLSRVNDAARVRDAVGGAVMTTVVDSTLVAVLLGVLWLYDLSLALAVTAFLPLFLLSVLAHHPAAWRRSQAAMEHSGQLYAHLMEDIAGVDTVKAFGAERARAEQGEARLARLAQANFALQKLRMSMNTLGTLLTALAGLAVLWLGSHRVMAGAISAGQLMFFFAVLGFVFDPLQRLAGVTLNIQDALVAVDRLYQVLDLDHEQPDGRRKAAFAGVRRAVELRDVSFSYGCRSDVLVGVNLDIPAGRTTAIVGESGSGKSTLLKLLLGFYGPTRGQIRIDGTDLRDLDLASLRGRIGLVAQDPFVFNGTLRDNVALGRPGAPLEEVIEAVRAAGLEEFVNALPERYDTVIGERGANLSGGQRQRLAIARVLLRRPDLLIFDEATSHLDTATERAIQENLRTALAGRTVVLVAHRLSTVKDADYIYVLNRGRVVEHGSHQELLAQPGWYAALWRSQSGAEVGAMSRAGQESPTRRAAAAEAAHRNGRPLGASEKGEPS
jgi:ATP-binding cassette subfamily B protein